MSLANKTFLIVTDQTETRDQITTILKPIVKTVVVAQNDSDAVSKISNQEFDAILLRTKRPALEDPSRVFQWCKNHKKFSRIPWVVLGNDIEPQAEIIKHANLKFLDNPKDGAALIKLLEGVFYSPEAAGAKGALDVNFINPFVAATVSTLEAMASVKVVRGAPRVRKPGEVNTNRPDVSGMIAMNSDRFLGSMALCFEERLILKVFSNMMGAETTAINDEVKDAVAEMTNIIFGNAKRDLNATGHTITPAIPSVVTGKGHEIRHTVDGVCILIPFESEFGKLVIECVMRPTTQA